MSKKVGLGSSPDADLLVSQAKRGPLKQCLKQEKPLGSQKSSLGHWDLRAADECACFTRVTLQVQHSDLLKALTPGHQLREKYDIIAIHPLSAHAFQAACRELDVDLIHFDLNDKLPFQLHPEDLAAAYKQGVHVEFCYRQMVKGSTDSCALFDSQAREICRATHGRNLIISSAAKALYELRGPFNICAVAVACGLQPAEAKLKSNNIATRTAVDCSRHYETLKATVTTHCLAVLKHAARQKGLRLDRHWPNLPKLPKASGDQAVKQQAGALTGSETRKRKAASQPPVEAAALKRSRAAAPVTPRDATTRQSGPGIGLRRGQPPVEWGQGGGSIQAEEKQSGMGTKTAVLPRRSLQGSEGVSQPSSAENRAPLEGKVTHMSAGSVAEKAGEPPESEGQAAALGKMPLARSLQALMLGHGQEQQQIPQPAQQGRCLPATDIGAAPQPEGGHAGPSSQGAKGGDSQLWERGLPPWKRSSLQQQPEEPALPMGRSKGQGKKEKRKKGGGLGGGRLGKKVVKTRKGWRD